MTTMVRVTLKIEDMTRGRLIADHAADVLVGAGDKCLADWILLAIPAMTGAFLSAAGPIQTEPCRISVGIQPLN